MLDIKEAEERLTIGTGHAVYSKRDNRHRKEYYAELQYSFRVTAPEEDNAVASHHYEPLFSSGDLQLSAQELMDVAYSTTVKVDIWGGYGGTKDFTLTVQRHADKPSLVLPEEDAWAWLCGSLADGYVAKSPTDAYLKIRRWLIDQVAAQYVAWRARVDEKILLREAAVVARVLSEEVFKRAIKIVRYKQRLAALRAELQAEVDVQVVELVESEEPIEFENIGASAVAVGLLNLPRFTKGRALGSRFGHAHDMPATLSGEKES